MTNEEDKKFLIAQRCAGREGLILSSKDNKLATEEAKLAAKQNRAQERIERQKQYQIAYETRNKTPDLSSLKQPLSWPEEAADKEVKRQRRGRKNFISPEVAITCDAVCLSSRKAAVVLSAAIHASGHHVADYNINYSTVHGVREKARSIFAQEKKQNFKPDPILTVHWDGKIVPDLVGKETVDRIAVVATGVSTDELLGVPTIGEGTGKEIANAVFSVINDWDLCSKIKAFSFDATSVNTGIVKGAIVILIERVNHDVLVLACRHHMGELILEAVFLLHMPVSGGPDIPLFKRFQQAWAELNKKSFTTGLANADVLAALGDEVDDLIIFAKNQIKVYQPRDDYKELLSLAIIFLGGVHPGGLKFMAPGAYNKTRWMSKAIYSLKIYMFQNQFHLTKHEKKGLLFISLFVVKVYLKYWFTSPAAIGAPLNDLQLIDDLKKFKKIDMDTATVGLRKISHHLWYISESLVPLSLFDNRISIETKRLCVSNLKHNKGLPDPPMRLPIYATECPSLPELFTTNSIAFFNILELPQSFLDVDPASWSDNVEYVQAEARVKGLKVVNDHAERAIQLMQNYNKKLTMKEERYQNLLQVTSAVNKRINKSKKLTADHIANLTI